MSRATSFLLLLMLACPVPLVGMEEELVGEEKACIYSIEINGQTHHTWLPGRKLGFVGNTEASDAAVRVAASEWAANLPRIECFREWCGSWADIEARIVEDTVLQTRSCRFFRHAYNGDDELVFDRVQCRFAIKIYEHVWSVDFDVHSSDAARDALADAFTQTLPRSIFLARCGETALSYGQQCAAKAIRDEMWHKHYECNNNRTHFIHVAKTAGTSVAYALGHKKCNCGRASPVLPQQMDTTMWTLPSFARVAFVARHPADRLISAMNHWRTRAGDGETRLAYSEWRMSPHGIACRDFLLGKSNIDAITVFAEQFEVACTMSVGEGEEDGPSTNAFYPISGWIDKTRLEQVHAICFYQLQQPSYWGSFAASTFGCSSKCSLSHHHRSKLGLPTSAEVVAADVFLRNISWRENRRGLAAHVRNDYEIYENFCGKVA